MGTLTDDLKPVEDDSGINKNSSDILSQLSSKERTQAKGGVGQKIKLESSPPYNQGECEEWFRSKGSNAFMILGRDRPGNLMSGYGGQKNHPASSAIRLTAGMGGRDIKEINREGEPLGLNPNNQKDAATIYISQKTDIDDKEQGFNLTHGSIGHVSGRSAIAMKADSMRILSRDGGIKLITSVDSKNSQGGDVESYADINFIAGNDQSGLQPLVKGYNLRAAIHTLFLQLSELSITVNQIVQQQNKLNIALKSHTHPVPPIEIPAMVTRAGTGTGVSSTGDAVTTTVVGVTTVPPPPIYVGTGPASGFTETSAPVELVGAETIEMFGGVTSQRLTAQKENIFSSNMNFVQNNNSTLYLLSKNVHTT